LDISVWRGKFLEKKKNNWHTIAKHKVPWNVWFEWTGIATVNKTLRVHLGLVTGQHLNQVKKKITTSQNNR
jgi:hypothetical protein